MQALVGANSTRTRNAHPVLLIALPQDGRYKEG
jgi:hypothetical protein